MVDRLVEQTAGNVIKKDFVIAVEKGTFAVGRQIKDIMWPAGALITQVVRENGESLIPDGKTELQAGDKLTIAVESVDFNETEEFISYLVEKNKSKVNLDADARREDKAQSVEKICDNADLDQDMSKQDTVGGDSREKQDGENEE